MTERGSIQLKKYREFGEIITELIAFFKQNFKALAGLYVKYALSVMIAGFVIGLWFTNNHSISVYGALGLMGGLGNILFIFFFGIATLSLSAAIFGYVKGYMSMGKREAMVYVPMYFWKNMGRICIVYLLMSMMAGLVALIFYLLFNLLGNWSILIMFISFFFIIYFWFKIILTPYIATEEDRTIAEAFQESYELTHGRWWWTFGLYFIMSTIASIFMYILMIPLYLLMFVPLFIGGDFSGLENEGMLMLIMNFVLYASYMIFGMVLILLLPFMYYALFDRKYGSSIADRIDAVDNNRQSIFENEGEV